MMLVTGGTGLLGSHVLYALLQTHDRVAALKRPTATLETVREIFSFYVQDPEPLIHRIDWRTGDLLDPSSLGPAMDGIDTIIHCAAIVSFDSVDKNKLISNNIDGTRNLANAIRAYQQQCPGLFLVHISSTAALGDSPGNDPEFFIDEETLRNPARHHNSYSTSKFESEQMIHELGAAAVILNPGIILGPGQWSRGSSQLFVKGWNGIRFYPYGGTGYVDVRDLASLIILLLNKHYGGERFCVVGANLRYREFFNRVTDEFGKPHPSIYAGRFLSGLVGEQTRYDRA